jgi:hypothetical protein
MVRDEDDMNWDDPDPYQPEHYEDHRPGPEDDPAVQELEPKLVAYFEAHPEKVYYESQLAVHFEKDYFHWVTVRALKDLRESGKIGSELQELTPKIPLRFYFHNRNRYWKRRAGDIRKLVRQFSDQAFTSALGVQGELLIDSGLPRVGFQPMGQNVRSWLGRTWPTTGHDLDRVFVRDGIAYGAEIKNRLGYIPQQEFIAKLQMCRALELTPLFIARMMPKTYIEDVRRAGGFSLLMKYQFYPVSHRALALKVRSELELPVDCPVRLQDTTLLRFLRWHEQKLQRQTRESSH